MAGKDSDKNQWKDPKDFGLPWVEIKPIKEISPLAEPVQEEGNSENPEAIPLLKANSIAEKTPVAETGKKKSEVQEKLSSKPANKTSKDKKSSFAWAWIVVVLAVAVVALIFWQMQSPNSVESLPTLAETKPEIPDPKPVEEQDSLALTSKTEEFQDSENQESFEKKSQADLNISKPAESGTTIAQSVKGNLIRIENQTERPQYFIVVGSLPSEQDAMKLAPGYQARVPEVFLIYPYAESSNYRLAIGKFTSFRKAAEELEKIKSQYTEELWILKY